MESTSAYVSINNISLKAYTFYSKDERTVLLISCWLIKHSFGGAAFGRVVYCLEKGIRHVLDMMQCH
jgi:hypothetical protein